MEFRAVGGVDLELSGSKADAYTQIAEYYKSEGRLGSKIVTYGATKNDVGISYMSGVRLCSERLSTHGWPAAVTELWLQYLHHVKPPLKKDDWIMTCHLVSTMEADGWEDITPEDVVEFLAEDEATGGSFRTIHYDWLKYMQSGAAELFLYLGSTPWQASGDPAHPDFEPVEEDMGPGPGAIVGAQMEEKGENPFLSRQDSVYLPCGHVQVYFPNAEPGDIEAQARQKADVKEFKRLQARMETAAAQVLKKRIMQQRIRLAHRYTTILIHYRPRQGMYKGGLFKFLFRLPQKYPIQAPLCHCLTPIWHPNIIHDADEQPREQNVCCSYLHDSSFADKQEEGYIPGMSLWKVVWAICLLLHRFDEEGLGIFTVSNPLNKEAADQFLNNEDGFIEKARAYTMQYATEKYQEKLTHWFPFYPDASVTMAEEKLGSTSSIDKRLPQTTLQQEESETGPEPIAHQSSPPEDMECKVYFTEIDATNYVEYRAGGQWYPAPVCDSVLVNLLCGEHNQFEQWLVTVEAVAMSPDDECNASLKERVLEIGPPEHLSGANMLPLPAGVEHADLLWFSGGAPDEARAQDMEPQPEPESDMEPIGIPEGVAPPTDDPRYVSTRLKGSAVGDVRAQLWEMHKQIYLFVEPESTATAIPKIDVMEGPGVSEAVTAHTRRLKQHFAAFSA